MFPEVYVTGRWFISRDPLGQSDRALCSATLQKVSPPPPVICTQAWVRALNQENLILTGLICSLFWLTKRNTYIFYIREISIIFLSAMKIDSDVITFGGCLMRLWQYKMDRNGGWCWIEDTVVSWTLSQIQNGEMKMNSVSVMLRTASQDTVVCVTVWWFS